jgi:hypothetical protein
MRLCLESREAEEGSAIETLGYTYQIVEYGGEGAGCFGASEGLPSSSEDSEGDVNKDEISGTADLWFREDVRF